MGRDKEYRISKNDYDRFSSAMQEMEQKDARFGRMVQEKNNEFNHKVQEMEQKIRWMNAKFEEEKQKMQDEMKKKEEECDEKISDLTRQYQQQLEQKEIEKMELKSNYEKESAYDFQMILE